MDLKRVELTSRAYECVFIKYVINSKAYRFYDLNVKVIIELKDVDFHVNIYPFKYRRMGTLVGALVGSRHSWGQNKFPFKNYELVGALYLITFM